MLIKIWENDYRRIIRAAYAEGAGVEGIDRLVERVAQLVGADGRLYRVETETGAFAAILVVDTGTAAVRHSFMRPHFRSKYGAELEELITSTTIRKEFYSTSSSQQNQ